MSSVATPPAPGRFGDHLRSIIDAGLEAVVLLGGTVRQTELRRAIGRHILQLPIDPERTILTRWTEQVGGFARRLELKSLRLRILLSSDEQFAGEAASTPEAVISVETDPNATRGTGGVLRDLAADLPDRRWLLIANANQAFVGDPVEAVERLAATGADMALMPAEDGNGGFLLLTRCECLKCIAPRGFIDLKEQALPSIASRFDVRVVDPRPDLTPTSIRSLRDYLELLAMFAGPSPRTPDELDWSPIFRIIEPGAAVAPGARIQNSVILNGARIESGAVVARCVVGPGGRVAPGQVVRDQIIMPGGEETSS